VAGLGETYGSIDLKLLPPGAYRLLGVPLRELAGTTPSDFVAPQIPGGGLWWATRSHLSKTERDAGRSLDRVTPRATENTTAMTDELRPNIFPALRYRDANAALEFLKNAFAAEEKAVYRGDDGTIHHAELRLGVGIVMFGGYSEDGFLGGHAPDPLASTVSLYVVVADPDGHYATATAAGANVVRELEDMDYGSREYSVRDPEGNLWSFGTYDPYANDDG
jgi:uncharacterized glyoxalase superfamily protein PhnB